jgi:predicted acyl esterase
MGLRRYCSVSLFLLLRLLTEVAMNRWQGEQDGKDGCDAIEYLAQLPWCTGKVGTTGNSWLAMCQWFIAAEQPLILRR